MACEHESNNVVKSRALFPCVVRVLAQHGGPSTHTSPSHLRSPYPTSVIAIYTHQVKSSVLSIALNSVISVTNQTGILSGVTTGTLKPLSEVESALSRAYLISA